MRGHDAIISNTATMLLGVWVFLTPWSMGLTALFGSRTIIGWSFWILGAALVISAFSSLIELKPWKQWLNFWLAFFLLIAPWLLGYQPVYYLYWNAIFPAFAIMVSALLGLEEAHRPVPRPRVRLRLIRNVDL